MSPVEQQQVTIPSLALLILLGALSVAAPDIETRLNFVSNLALNTRDAIASIKGCSTLVTRTVTLSTTCLATSRGR